MPIAKTINTRGARLSYTRIGTGTPVMLIQGVGAIGNVWRPQVEALRDRYSVIAFDNRGIGASTIIGGSLSIEAMADDVLAILDAEEIARCHVVGHSMGGLIAMQVALTSPRRVKSLALLCTFPDGQSGARLTRDTFLAGLRSRIGTRAMRRKAFMELILSEAGLERRNRERLAGELAELFGRDLAEQPRIIMRQLRAMSRFDPKWRLRCLAAVRTLIVSGERDRIALPSYGRRLAAFIPGSIHIELANVAHAVPIESPGLINRLLLEHIDERRTKDSRAG